MPTGFRWKLGDWVGGQTAVHQAYKPWLALRPDSWAIGEFLVQPRDTSDLTFNLGFRPTVLFLISYRPRNANLGNDAAFGARGGGMTFGVAGVAGGGSAWSSATTYNPGDVVRHEGARYAAVDTHSNSEPPSAHWLELDAFQFTGSSRIRHGFEPTTSYWNEDCCFRVAHDFAAIEVLKLTATLTSTGFVLHQDVNLYDQTDYIAYLAMSGSFQTGAITTGDTAITGFDTDATAAVFLSTKHAPGVTYRGEYWDHMTGFASLGGVQACIWGGKQPTSWDWTTERWQDDAAIVLCTPAAGSSFAGASYDVGGIVSSWNTGGINLQWPVYGNQLYRVGYVLAGMPSDSAVLETNWETRPGGSQNDFSGGNFEPSSISPHVILMAATNYNFSWSNADPFDWPRSPNQFGFGGSGGLGWHAAPFSEAGYDAYGVHTFGNAVSERGHYSNSGTQYLRRYILAGQGANSNPPAYHQHSVNVIENPVIVGTNYRYAERHSHVKRLHVNPSDT